MVESQNMSDLELMDRSILDGFKKFGQGEFISSMIDLFFKTTGGALGEIASLVALEDWKGVAFSVHSLRSGASNLGLVRLTKMAESIEAAAKKADSTTVREQSLLIPAIYLESCEALKAYQTNG